MSVVFCGLSSLSIAVLFYSYREHYERTIDKQRALRERVAYMLWVMANGVPEH